LAGQKSTHDCSIKANYLEHSELGGADCGHYPAKKSLVGMSLMRRKACRTVSGGLGAEACTCL